MLSRRHSWTRVWPGWRAAPITAPLMWNFGSTKMAVEANFRRFNVPPPPTPPPKAQRPLSILSLQKTIGDFLLSPFRLNHLPVGPPEPRSSFWRFISNQTKRGFLISPVFLWGEVFLLYLFSHGEERLRCGLDRANHASFGSIRCGYIRWFESPLWIWELLKAVLDSG